ncbi:hypothetical protein CJF30_00011453 [Rutstroemia sp. NJR-2017a BBW]|nr:hypothetical protein CJF30_00011453 [Rutstroemia sp. NJR-2017a BBW]
MACCYHTAVDTDTTDFELLSKGFSNAVRHKLDAEEESLLSVQVFAIMFLTDCAQGKGLYASKYLTVANSSIASQECIGDNIYQGAWMCTARGVNCLNITNPHGNTNLDDEEYSTNIDDISQALYRIPKDNITKMDWHSAHIAIVNKEKAKLLSIVRDVEVLLYNPSGPSISARDMLIVYSRFLAWRRDLPKVISNTSDKHTQLLPHTLSLLILYHTAVVQLLRPLLDLEGFSISLVDHIVWRHAQYGLFLLHKHYHSLEFCQYLSVTQMFAILHLTDVIARFFPNVSGNHGIDGPTAVQLAIKILAKSRFNFPIAGTFIELIYKTAKDIITPLPNDLEELFRRSHPNRSKFLLDDTIDACTRTTYTQPVHNIQRRFSPTISSDWAAICTAF